MPDRKLTYSLAINEAFKQIMSTDPEVIVLGQGVKSPWYVGNTCNDLIMLFGEERVIDTPISENAMTGVAVGAAISGIKAVIIHPRIDFALYAFDPIINQAANWSYMSGGRSSVPVVFWLAINRGGEQAAQHSQALQSLFTHIPGLKVIAPSNAFDAKGLLISAIRDPNPVIFIDDRWLYNKETFVPKDIYEIPIGKGNILHNGHDITVVTSSYLSCQVLECAEIMAGESVSVEVIDLRTLKPLDADLVLESARKTKRVVLVDGTWRTGGYNAEIAAMIYEHLFKVLKAPIVRVNLPDAPAPASRSLESEYYVKNDQIIQAIKHTLSY